MSDRRGGNPLDAPGRMHRAGELHLHNSREPRWRDADLEASLYVRRSVNPSAPPISSRQPDGNRCSADRVYKPSDFIKSLRAINARPHRFPIRQSLISLAHVERPATDAPYGEETKALDNQGKENSVKELCMIDSTAMSFTEKDLLNADDLGGVNSISDRKVPDRKFEKNVAPPSNTGTGIKGDSLKALPKTGPAPRWNLLNEDDDKWGAAPDKDSRFLSKLSLVGSKKQLEPIPDPNAAVTAAVPPTTATTQNILPRDWNDDLWSTVRGGAPPKGTVVGPNGPRVPQNLPDAAKRRWATTDHRNVLPRNRRNAPENISDDIRERNDFRQKPALLERRSDDIAPTPGHREPQLQSSRDGSSNKAVLQGHGAAAAAVSGEHTNNPPSLEISEDEISRLLTLLKFGGAGGAAVASQVLEQWRERSSYSVLNAASSASGRFSADLQGPYGSGSLEKLEDGMPRNRELGKPILGSGQSLRSWENQNSSLTRPSFAPPIVPPPTAPQPDEKRFIPFDNQGAQPRLVKEYSDDPRLQEQQFIFRQMAAAGMTAADIAGVTGLLPSLFQATNSFPQLGHNGPGSREFSYAPSETHLGARSMSQNIHQQRADSSLRANVSGKLQRFDGEQSWQNIVPQLSQMTSSPVAESRAFCTTMPLPSLADSRLAQPGVGTLPTEASNPLRRPISKQHISDPLSAYQVSEDLDAVIRDVLQQSAIPNEVLPGGGLPFHPIAANASRPPSHGPPFFDEQQSFTIAPDLLAHRSYSSMFSKSQRPPHSYVPPTTDTVSDAGFWTDPIAVSSSTKDDSNPTVASSSNWASTALPEVVKTHSLGTAPIRDDSMYLSFSESIPAEAPGPLPGQFVPPSVIDHPNFRQVFEDTTLSPAAEEPEAPQGSYHRSQSPPANPPPEASPSSKLPASDTVLPLPEDQKNGHISSSKSLQKGSRSPSDESSKLQIQPVSSIPKSSEQPPRGFFPDPAPAQPAPPTLPAQPTSLARTKPTAPSQSTQPTQLSGLTKPIIATQLIPQKPKIPRNTRGQPTQKQNVSGEASETKNVKPVQTNPKPYRTSKPKIVDVPDIEAVMREEEAAAAARKTQGTDQATWKKKLANLPRRGGNCVSLSLVPEPAEPRPAAVWGVKRSKALDEDPFVQIPPTEATTCNTEVNLSSATAKSKGKKAPVAKISLKEFIDNQGASGMDNAATGAPIRSVWANVNKFTASRKASENSWNATTEKMKSSATEEPPASTTKERRTSVSVEPVKDSGPSAASKPVVPSPAESAYSEAENDRELGNSWCTVGAPATGPKNTSRVESKPKRTAVNDGDRALQSTPTIPVAKVVPSKIIPAKSTPLARAPADSPVSNEEAGQLLRQYHLQLDNALVDFLKEFTTPAEIVEVLESNIGDSVSPSDLNNFAVAFLDIYQNPFRPVPAKVAVKSRSNKQMSTKRNPGDFLKQVLGRSVVVRLNDGTDYKGLLACLDDRMNLALEQVEEIVGDAVTGQYNDAFIRGNNVLYIAASAKKPATGTVL